MALRLAGSRTSVLRCIRAGLAVRPGRDWLLGTKRTITDAPLTAGWTKVHSCCVQIAWPCNVIPCPSSCTTAPISCSCTHCSLNLNIVGNAETSAGA